MGTAFISCIYVHFRWALVDHWKTTLCYWTCRWLIDIHMFQCVYAGSVTDSHCAHAMVKLYLGYFRRGLAEPQCTCNGSYRLWALTAVHRCKHCAHVTIHILFTSAFFFFLTFVLTADEDLRWPLPSGALHGVYHRSLHGVPSSRLPQTLPRDAALHLRDRVQKGMCTCTHRHTHPAVWMTWGSSWLCNLSDMAVAAVLRTPGCKSSWLYLIWAIYFGSCDIIYTCFKKLHIHWTYLLIGLLFLWL